MQLVGHHTFLRQLAALFESSKERLGVWITHALLSSVYTDASCFLTPSPAPRSTIARSSDWLPLLVPAPCPQHNSLLAPTSSTSIERLAPAFTCPELLTREFRDLQTRNARPPRLLKGLENAEFQSKRFDASQSPSETNPLASELIDVRRPSSVKPRTRRSFKVSQSRKNDSSRPRNATATAPEE
ncbi:hypothetical protein D9611_005337 [Ephemerocybe angulata]|uniref:Uncharacterized protein n=1 Tax=Ephemerocybe angulata TaxID=980116 RepID=A0A8H5C0A0_9AGAR|nr:hypothetical protein D9611_005337 [Tulosesus angulatus]